MKSKPTQIRIKTSTEEIPGKNNFHTLCIVNWSLWERIGTVPFYEHHWPRTNHTGSLAMKHHFQNNCLLVCCLTSQQHASVSQGWRGPDNSMCCHTEIEVADQTFHLTQLQYTDTGPTSPSTDPITPGAWHGSHWSANF